MGIGAKMIGGIAQETRTADEMIAYYRDMSESEYERLKEKVWKGAKMKNGIMKYHPAFIAQRKMQKELQNKGYNDIFISNLMVLSPTYAEYKKALVNVSLYPLFCNSFCIFLCAINAGWYFIIPFFILAPFHTFSFSLSYSLSLISR